MMTVNDIKQLLPDYAKDLKLNLDSVLTTQGAPGLTETQIWGTALAAAIAARNTEFASQIETLVRGQVDEATVNGAKAAAAIMGMNNIYYRFIHLVEDKEYGTLPARLRMNVIGKPGIEKVDFELYSLAVSAINGCGLCITAHERELRKHGLGREAIQSAARIAAVIHAVAVTLEYERAAVAV
jgi:alkyl hydroperoxide reductase subunit D